MLCTASNFQSKLLGELCAPPQSLFPCEESELSGLSPVLVFNPEPVHQDVLLREQIRAILVGGSVSAPSCCFSTMLWYRLLRNLYTSGILLLIDKKGLKNRTVI